MVSMAAELAEAIKGGGVQNEDLPVCHAEIELEAGVVHGGDATLCRAANVWRETNTTDREIEREKEKEKEKERENEREKEKERENEREKGRGIINLVSQVLLMDNRSS